MKSVILFTLVAALIVGFRANLPSTRSSLYLGHMGPGDRLLNRTFAQKRDVPWSIQSENVVYRGNSSTKITAIEVIELGGSRRARTWILSGGIGRSNVTLRIYSDLGYGYKYRIDIWGQ